MMELRQLTEVEQERAQKAGSYRTLHEKRAYRYLPDYMRKRAKRNVAVAFKNSSWTYFPDMFFENEGICLEIDGNSHKNRFRIRKDARRDRIFESSDFITIRIENRHIGYKYYFLQILKKKLMEIQDPREGVLAFIREIDKAIIEETTSWITIEEFEQY